MEKYGQAKWAADTHSEYVMLITFPQQQLLREREALLRYVHCVSRSTQILSIILYIKQSSDTTFSMCLITTDI